MNKIIYIVFTSIFLTSNVVSQEFSEVTINPFGIDVDTTGNLFIYSCNFVDFDGDSDIDLIYTYLDSMFHLAIQENVGTVSSPDFSKIEKLNIDVELDQGFFLPDFADMNADGLVDMISFGASNDSTGFNCVYYQNQGNNLFDARPGVEIGLPGIGNAAGVPEIVDLNQDGDKDLILSGAFQETFSDDTDALYYFGQNSSASDPSFTAWFIEPYSFAFMDTFQSAIIKTGDLDLDGDLDFLMNVSISDDETRFMFQENNSPPSEKNDFSGLPIVSPFGLPENSEGLHFLEDLDGDGDLDLFVLGNLEILYYENTSCVNSFSEVQIDLCDETSYVLNGQTYTSSGTYMQALMNINGCDSTINLILNLNQSTSSQFEASICEGDVYSWNGMDFDEAGTYMQSFISQSGCDSIVELTLKETTIEFDLSQTDGTLMISAVTGDISWINCDTNFEIEGESANTFTPEEDGSYAVQIEYSGCNVTSDCVNVMSSSLIDLSKNSEIVLFPNPAKDFIFIDSNSASGEFVTAEFVSLVGQTLTKKIDNNMINISDLKSGFYFVKIEDASNFYVKTIVISKAN